MFRMKKHLIRKKSRSLRVGLITLLIVLTSCNDKITDLFEAIKDYGYRLENPLGPKSTKIDKELVGGYVYDGLPVIIEEKNSTTYSIKFLTTSLYKEDRVIDGHLTMLGKYAFMNLDMGNYFCVAKSVLSPDGFFRVSLVRNALDTKIPENKLKNFLTNHAGDEKYEYKNSEGEEREIRIYSTFSFERVTPAKAYQLQEDELYSHKTSLYENCKSIKKYQRLEELFPPDKSLVRKGHLSILENCENFEEIELFMATFPNSPVADIALQKLDEIKTEQLMAEWYRQDSVAFYNAKDKGTIEAFQVFLEDPKTEEFNKRANTEIRSLANNITHENIEWKWTSGKAESATQSIFYMIDYADLDNQDYSFLADRLTYYSLKKLNRKWREKVIDCFGKMVALNPGHDAMLDIYMGKGFVLWSLPRLDLTVMAFKSQVKETYLRDETSFKKAFKSKFKYYTKEEGIDFPEQKSTYRTIKKLK